MPPTLGAVLRTPRLGLRLLSGDDVLDRPVRWVAVSELSDPTPYLAGGELLLTTGVRWPEGQQAARGYVRRLVGRGITALGFGSGVVRDEVPSDLAEAAAEFGLPIIDVPESTPFIAVGEEVSRLLAREEYEGLTRAFAAQRELTRAALRGPGAVADRLAAELAGWVLLLTAEGEVRQAAPASAAEHAAALDAEIRRLGASGRHASASLAVGEERVWLQPLGAGRRIRGYLAVGAGHHLDSTKRTLVNAAVSLLSLELERPPASGEELPAGTLEALLGGAVALDTEAAARLRAALPVEPVVVAVCDVPAGPSPVDDPALDGFPAAETGTRLTVLGSENADPAAALLRAAGGPVGASPPGGHDALPAARVQAERALDAARSSARALVRFAERPGGFRGLLDDTAAEHLARQTLAPLLGHRNSEDLLGALRAYLAAAGRWDVAAADLGVHRHTLRNRITRVRELLDGDLDDPDYRTDLWLALRALETAQRGG